MDNIKFLIHAGFSPTIYSTFIFEMKHVNDFRRIFKIMRKKCQSIKTDFRFAFSNSKYVVIWKPTQKLERRFCVRLSKN